MRSKVAPGFTERSWTRFCAALLFQGAAWLRYVSRVVSQSGLDQRASEPVARAEHHAPEVRLVDLQGEADVVLAFLAQVEARQDLAIARNRKGIEEGPDGRGEARTFVDALRIVRVRELREHVRSVVRTSMGGTVMCLHREGRRLANIGG